MTTLSECTVMVAKDIFVHCNRDVQYSDYNHLKKKEAEYYTHYVWKKDTLKKNCGHWIAKWKANPLSSMNVYFGFIHHLDESGMRTKKQWHSEDF